MEYKKVLKRFKWKSEENLGLIFNEKLFENSINVI
jgi:hypothetical protein